MCHKAGKIPPTCKDCRQEWVLGDFGGYKNKPGFVYSGSWKAAVVLFSFYKSDPRFFIFRALFVFFLSPLATLFYSYVSPPPSVKVGGL